MMKLIAAFCDYVNTTKNICKRWDYEQVRFVKPPFQRLTACSSSGVLTGKYLNFEGMWGLHFQGHAVQESFFPLIFSSVVKTSRLHVQDAYLSSVNTQILFSTQTWVIRHTWEIIYNFKMFFCCEQAILFSSLAFGRNPVGVTAFIRCALLLPGADGSTIMSNMDHKEIWCDDVDWIHLIQYVVQWPV